MDRVWTGSRGQFVLTAAAVVAIALASVVLASLQLGYHADVRASSDYDAPNHDAVRALERAVHEATADVPGNYTWSERSTAADAVRSRLAARFDTIEAARTTTGTGRRITYNRTVAGRRAGTVCPSGPDRQFGTCVADGGLVLQERAGRTHVRAVVVDLTTTTDRERTRLTVVVRPVGGAVGV
ncbi:MAG: hypothetical protein ABEH35_05620 [Haloarculaceae archaeon]